MQAKCLAAAAAATIFLASPCVAGLPQSDPTQRIHRDGEVVAGRYLIHLREAGLTASKLESFEAAVSDAGGRIERRFGVVPIVVVVVEAAGIASIAAHPAVARIEPDRWHCPTIKTATDAAHHAADLLQARGIRGRGVTLGLIDTGIDEALRGSPPSANLFPGLPSAQRLPKGVRIAIRVPQIPAGTVGGFELWSGAAQPTSLAIAVYADNNGMPGSQPIATSSLAVVRDAGFQRSIFATPIRLTSPTTLWFAFTTPTATDLEVIVDCGVEVDVVEGATNTRTRRPLGYRVVLDGQVARPHRAFLEAATPGRDARIVVQKKVGALDPALVDRHGTALASVAAGAGWLSQRADAGHAPEARIASYACADDSQGNAMTSTILHAWEKLACDVEPLDIEVAVIGFSGSPDPTSAEQRMLDAVARNTDLVVVSAAGNNGASTRSSPATLHGISVGAATANKVVASFSSFGQVAGAAYPDLVAHGERVVSAQTDDESLDYVTSGTSLAAAQVAGAALLVRAANPRLSANEVRAALLASSEASPGTGSTQVTTGAGCGYLRDDRAHELATKAGLVGTDTVSKARPLWLRDVPVRAGQDYAFAIAWMRSDTSAAGGSNLDVVIKNSSGLPIARSLQVGSTQEFVRLRASSNETWRIEVATTFLAEPVVHFSFASTSDFGAGQGTARYSEFETGCKGSGTGGGCPALAQSPQDLSFMPGLPPKTRFACLVQCPCEVTIKGFSMRMRASLPNTAVQCYLYKSTPTLEPQLVASASAFMTVQVAEAYYAVTFPTPVTLAAPEAGNFFIAFRTPDTATLWTDNGTLKLGHHYELPDSAIAWIGGDGYQGAITEIAWDWKVACTPGLDCPGGPEPCLEGDELPIIGSQRFAVRLLQGLPNGVGVLMTGIEIPCVPLAGIGAPACNLCCNTIYNVGAVINSQGLARVPFPVPQTTGLVGVNFAQQWLLLDQRANRLGLTLSGPGLARIGTH